ncbi:hypothetical protein [Ponticoccus sp. (in: a-proteobacteria)]|uniref:hypothetical protein n=1 Tax=Ponticoccus sp. (in: a-proteobacteria) TaxID=1925025 RepID=UPI003AB81598
MDVILHLGAHRTGSTSFQHWLRAHRAGLQAAGIGFWGPWRTRSGLLNGIADPRQSAQAAARRAGRLGLNLARAKRHSLGALVVSDENMLGTPRRCLRRGVLYHDAGERLARLSQAFGQPRRIVLQIRSLDAWWASGMAWLIPRGEAVPAPEYVARIAGSARSWRHVVTDIACACPGTEIVVTAFETYGNRPDRLLAAMTGRTDRMPLRAGTFWANRRPDLATLRACLAGRGQDGGALRADGPRWQPFDAAQVAELRERYADDLFWLMSGADGLASLRQEEAPARPGIHPAAGLKDKGQGHDRSARRLAPHRREGTARQGA